MDNSIKETLFSMQEEMQIFKHFDKDELEKFTPYASIAHYPSEAVVFKEGESDGFIGFVISGKLQVKKQTEFENKEVMLAILPRGSFAGELSMIDGHKRTATIKAIEDSNLLILTREALDQFILEYPEAGVKVLRGIIHTMSVRQRMTSERLLSFF